MSENSIANVFYEIGLMQATGKETLVIKTPRAKVPSDLVRTEYLEYSRGFTNQFHSYIDKLWQQADYYADMAEQLINSPIPSTDYIARAYLITGEEGYKEQIKKIALKTISETNPVIRTWLSSNSEE